jgi:hypothetical protein
MLVSMHAAVAVAGPQGRECRTCGAPVIGFGPELRHEGEAFRVTTPDPKDARAFAAALAEALAAARSLPPDAQRVEVVRAVVETIYVRDRLKRHPRSGARRLRAAERAARVAEACERDITEPLHHPELAGVA